MAASAQTIRNLLAVLVLKRHGFLALQVQLDQGGDQDRELPPLLLGQHFSVICELVGMEQAIAFAYEPVSHYRSDLATFHVEDMQITGEFNLVYMNEKVAGQKVETFFSD